MKRKKYFYIVCKKETGSPWCSQTGMIVLFLSKKEALERKDNGSIIRKLDFELLVRELK